MACSIRAESATLRLIGIGLLKNPMIVSISAGLVVVLLDPGFEDAGEAIWWSFLRLSDPGYLGDDEGVVSVSVSTVVTVLGYVLFLGLLIVPLWAHVAGEPFIITLATKVVILEKGVVRQIGTPAEIYHRPANVFVAEFIGSPPMNVIPVENWVSAGFPDSENPRGMEIRVAAVATWIVWFALYHIVNMPSTRR